MNVLPKISVAIRKRPLTRKELNRNESDIVEIVNEKDLVLKELRVKVDMSKYIEEHEFTFDGSFSDNESNEDLYKKLVRPLVASAFDSSKITCFAYGQTGSGKTFTMMGSIENNVPGLYLLAAKDIFSLINTPQYNSLFVGISFYEIYCSRAFDLLNNRELCQIRVDAKENVNIVGLTEKIISNTESLMMLIKYGLSVRITGTTGMNDDSSRSHAILQITLRNKFNKKQHGKLSFIDLAGSERGADVTDTNKQTRLDGAEINKSLLALKECIRAMDQEKRHLPFRGSKLTLVLKDSFVGDCKTLMIGNISPAQSSCEHTLNTLRYADRVKELKKPSNQANAREKNPRDELARVLMLPRMNKNANRIMLNNGPSNNGIVFQSYNYSEETFSKNQNKKTSDKTLHNNSYRFSEGNKNICRSREMLMQSNEMSYSDQNYKKNQFGFEENIDNESLYEDCMETQTIDLSEEIPRDQIQPTRYSKNDIQPFQNAQTHKPNYNSFIKSVNHNDQFQQYQVPPTNNHNGLFQNYQNNEVNFNQANNDFFDPSNNRPENNYPFNSMPRLQKNNNYGNGLEEAKHLDYNLLEDLSRHQDELMDEHSNQIDNFVDFVKEDMELLQNLKEKR